MKSKQQSKLYHPRFIIKFILLEVFLFIVLIIWYLTHINTISAGIIRDKLTEIASNVEYGFVDSFDNSEIIIAYIGELITKLQPYDDNQILNLLETIHNQFKLKELFTWSALTWSDSNFNLKVDSALGITKPPYKDVSNRDFIHKTVTQPWVIHIGRTSIGYITGLSVIPFGLGVVDNDGKYIGTLTSAFEVNKVLDKLVHVADLNDTSSFLIFDKEGNVLVESKDKYISKNYKKVTEKFFKTKSKSKLIQISNLTLFTESNGIFIRKINGIEGYYIAIALHDLPWGKMISSSFKKSFYDLALILSICIIIFIFTNRFIVKPVVELSKAAERITKNDRNVQINEYTTKEIALLANSLNKVIFQKTELIEANEKLEFLLKKLESLNKAKSDFIRNIQHELRTPLNHIIGGCDVLNSQFAGPLAPEYIEYVSIINQSGKDLLNKINNIISVADFESGNMSLNEEKCSVNEVINLALNQLFLKISQYKLKLKLEIQPNLPSIYVDPEKIKAALFNIINNAIVFNKPDGNIIISAEQTESGITIQITDNGQGIAPDNLARITDMFSTATGDMLTKVRSGLGLGLTIAQSILDLHDIKMEIDSKVSEGTIVKVNIPNIRLKKRKGNIKNV